ncbi:homoserine dehydrogenase [Candidatus Saganbacteria bacterium]|nr:homoserine dehydrogenase [Candidatus Saganbacteria bacterium]
MKKVKIGILGYGTVGSAVDRLIQKNPSLGLEVKKICDISPKVKHSKLTRRASDVINDPDIEVVVETIGGVNPAKKFVLAALRAGKSVVTSNKELIALNLKELAAAAQKNKVALLFEAAVGGGIPILGPLMNDLSADRIFEVYGIVNGTTNYILHKMTKEGMSFSEALKRAKEKGYAEADPKKDIEGFDASYKAAILAMVAFRAEIGWKKVAFEGIARIEPEDIRYAQEIGYVIKLLAAAQRRGEEIEVSVHPTLIPCDHPLAFIPGPMNAIYVKGEPIGELMFYGQGAGGGPTASAVVGDILKITKNKSQITNLELGPVKMKDTAHTYGQFYIRMLVPDKSGVLAKISKIFANAHVSIAVVNQRETVGKNANLVIVTHEARQADLDRALARLKKLPVVRKVCNIIRVGL